MTTEKEKEGDDEEEEEEEKKEEWRIMNNPVELIVGNQSKSMLRKVDAESTK
jgi:hypothetical protein